ncbi:hypothetical protein CSB37_03805 [bacterium DOLZORAL124_38_8]|nr:MAG: hypothetical protein CSB37_03805 [bacterium DOLZORAL124_38_8]
MHTHKIKLLSIALFTNVLLACQTTPPPQEQINQAAQSSGISYRVYESFDTIPNFQAVAPSLFAQILKHPNTVLIDVRTPQEIKNGKILDSAQELNFYDPNFETQIKQLNKNKIYAIYCRTGNRSKQVLKKLKQFGFKEAYHLYKGIKNWNLFFAPQSKEL